MNDDRDPALDALLGEHSTETPPAHIDAAILAAAHRAVASSPRPALATQAWRWWMPLAAAAAIGLIVVGVLPLAPSIVSESPPTVTDVPAKVTAPERKLERDRPVSGQIRKDRVPDEAADARKSQAAAAGALGSAAESSPAPIPRDAVSPLARPGLAAPQRAMSADARDDFDARPHSADDWIARIRALRNRGDVHEATRALADFRAAFSDADARLPADLREWANALR